MLNMWMCMRVGKCLIMSDCSNGILSCAFGSLIVKSLDEIGEYKSDEFRSTKKVI